MAASPTADCADAVKMEEPDDDDDFLLMDVYKVSLVFKNRLRKWENFGNGEKCYTQTPAADEKPPADVKPSEEELVVRVGELEEALFSQVS